VRVGAESRARAEGGPSANATHVRRAAAIAAAGIPNDAVRRSIAATGVLLPAATGRRAVTWRNVVEVRVDDLTRLGDCHDASVVSGATSIHDLAFDLKQRTGSNGGAGAGGGRRDGAPKRLAGAKRA
jgi:hypothetical protein